jgi:hypothetical protein
VLMQQGRSRWSNFCHAISVLTKALLWQDPFHYRACWCDLPSASRDNARQKVFFTDTDRELFLTTLEGLARRYGLICHARLTEGGSLSSTD